MSRPRNPNLPPDGDDTSGVDAASDIAGWSRIKALFQEAVEHPPAARQAFLHDACGDDPAILEEVRKLLAADLPDRFLESTPTAPPTGAVATADARVGAYRLVEPIGEGGMGSVWSAERADGAFDKRVAVKLIKRGTDAKLILDRFESERQVLALLEHPHIARLLDGGTADDGAPYLVMEHVDGEPIDEYCDRHELPIRKRVELFQDVCAAVHFAHINLVVHRDLKPSNILVTAEGQVKLLDFGIAKVLGGSIPQRDVTATTHRPMTPRYASPEQIRGEPITTATDVYALGVLLYELLTGRDPYGWAPKTQSELEHLVCEAEPRRPSTAVTFDPPVNAATDARRRRTPEELARIRASRVAQLERSLRGDLDNIALMALRKEPDRRYPSAEQLADDLQRYLDGFPVRARPETLSYRARKFVHRNPLLVFGTAALIAVSVTAAIVSTTSAIRATRAETQAQADADEARRQTAVAEAVNAFLETILAQADPINNPQGKDLTLLEAVELAGGLVEESFTGQPDVESAVRFSLGVVDLNLGRLERSVEQLEQALALAVEAHGESHRRTLHCRAQLGLALLRLGRADEAKTILEAGLEDARAAAPEDWAITSQIDNQLGLLYLGRGDGAAAERHLRASLDQKSAVLAGDTIETLTTEHNLSGALWMQGKHDESIRMATDVLRRRRATLGEVHPHVAQSLNTVAYLLMQTERYEEALELRREDLEMRRSLYEGDHPDLARSLNNMGHLLHTMERSEEALAFQQEGVEMWRRTLPPTHPDLIRSMGTLASIHDALEQHADAARVRAEHVAIFRQTVPEDDPRISDYLTALAGSLEKAGDLDAAEAAYREALALREAAVGPDHWQTISCRSLLGDFLTRQGRLEEAEPLVLESAAAVEGMTDAPPGLAQRAIEFAIRFCEAAGLDDEAAAWRAKAALTE